MNSKGMKRYAPLILRLAIAILFLWFGFSQLKDVSSWQGMVPNYLSWIASSSILIYFNAIFEIVFAIFLILGFKVRLTSGLLTLHLLHIATILGYGPVAIRDLALAFATFSIFLSGKDEFCLDVLLKKRKKD